MVSVVTPTLASINAIGGRVINNTVLIVSHIGEVINKCTTATEYIR